MTINLKISIPAKPSYGYPIILGTELFTNWSNWIEEYAPHKKIIIISDSNVTNLYGAKFAEQLTENGYKVKLLSFLAGELSKNIQTKLALEEQMFEFGVDRHTLCIALGGGVVGDLAGFTAATYMRGINFIQIPTSLLAMIDSSVGGKTAVNTSYGKNIIGAFWQPKAVIMDTQLLHTLPAEHINNGLFEAIKIFLTCDLEYFNYCVSYQTELLSLAQQPLVKMIQRAVALKAHVVEVDEFEQNLRMILNFGHTVGHALEKLSHYELLHGFGVALGMIVEAKIAVILGLLAEKDYLTIKQFLSNLGANSQALNQYTVDEIITAMRGDKKNINQQIKLVLLTGIGQVKNIDNQVAFAVDEQIIYQALEQVKAEKS